MIYASDITIKPSPRRWKKPCTHSECSLNQLSPYIGKLKSSIAYDLISEYSNVGDLVVDPFSGSGTIPLEAKMAGRNVFASDISPYAILLSKAKLNPPESKEDALILLNNALERSKKLPDTDLRTVPIWVREFFHPRTLKESIKFAEYCNSSNQWFLLSCLLGILHHQRPGFLSYPSSHLVPYLRSKKFPRDEFPEMYEYRDLESRMIRKIDRIFKRPAIFPNNCNSICRKGSVLNIKLPESFDCLITSPPYMNALDYGRDNRLRLWFLNQGSCQLLDNNKAQCTASFVSSMSSLLSKVNNSLVHGGHCIFIVGDSVKRNGKSPSQALHDLIDVNFKNLRLKKIVRDKIPDIRRARRDCKGVKEEHILIYERV
ncbi:DNA methyltransferase [Pontiellaceae bacterium B12227]|nr:DNA methyltransferase [Pontiellaceae bacterium B12227]